MGGSVRQTDIKTDWSLWVSAGGSIVRLQILFSTLLFIRVFIVTSEVMHFSLNYFRLSRFHYERNLRLENVFKRILDSISQKKTRRIGDGSELLCAKKQFTVKYALVYPVSVGFNIIGSKA